MSLDTPTAMPSSAAAAEPLDSLTAVFRRVLELDEVAADANFFLLGGDSLIATRVLSAVARAHGVELTFEDFLTDPTPAGLAARIAAATDATATTGATAGTGTATTTVPAAR
ncbi:acyl carrier protein [Kitasatospora sp. NPDC088391]|uniref:acyl carrier protein n=1 Tax=Kitasatospora sp. NPDC088391 TaxID=3364074 RepID=UPI00380826BE